MESGWCIYSEAEEAALRGDSQFLKVNRNEFDHLKETENEAKRLRMTLDKVEDRFQILQWRQTQGDKLLNETMYRENRDLDLEVGNLRKLNQHLVAENDDMKWKKVFEELKMSTGSNTSRKRARKRGQGRAIRRKNNDIVNVDGVN